MNIIIKLTPSTFSSLNPSVIKSSLGQRIRIWQLYASVIFCLLCGTTIKLPAQSFDSYAAGDDLTSSLGQFQVILDQAWVKIFDVIMANSPLATTAATR